MAQRSAQGDVQLPAEAVEWVQMLEQGYDHEVNMLSTLAAHAQYSVHGCKRAGSLQGGTPCDKHEQPALIGCCCFCPLHAALRLCMQVIWSAGCDSLGVGVPASVPALSPCRYCNHRAVQQSAEGRHRGTRTFQPAVPPSKGCTWAPMANRAGANKSVSNNPMLRQLSMLRQQQCCCPS